MKPHSLIIPTLTIILYLLISPLSITAISIKEPLPNRVVKNRSPLQQNSFYTLPLGSIKPKGWLLDQLKIQAQGLTGNIDEFWPDLGPNSGWLGGDGESWERGPYFMDGLVPLAYLLDDPKLIAKARKWVNWTLDNQRKDGFIGPVKNTDWWPNMVLLKALTQYHEATNDPRVIPLMERYFQYQAELISKRPLREWAIYRWYEELPSLWWLYNRNGDKRLLELAKTLQRQGYDWREHFADFKFTSKTNKEMLGLKLDMSNTTDLSMRAHGVNNSMAIKMSPLWWLLSGEQRDREAIYQQFKVLDMYHLLPNGMHSGDEHYAGKDPSQGVELCSVVETMFSLQQSIAILGNPILADRLEKITFNALPATFSNDMWSHQYDQQPNQVMCNIDPRSWTSNGREANVFGLEPNFGCCTVNMHQGWPKFVASLWMQTSDDGIAAITYAPSELKTVVNGSVPVRITEETEYPFKDRIVLKIDPASKVSFPLHLRIPAWAKSAKVHVNSRELKGVKSGAFFIIKRKWSKGDKVELTLPLKPHISRSYNDSAVVERGSLIFSLKIGEDWKKLSSGMHKPAIPPAADWEVLPTTSWNYGLAIDPTNPEKSLQLIEREVGKIPFSSEDAPIEIKVKGRKIPEWVLVKGSAGTVPVSPVASREREELLTLIPYGAAKLRITAFPLLANR
jgi:uncharacterized protein